MSAATLTKVVAYVRRLTDLDTRALTDGALLERFTQERDETAFAELVRRHGGMVLATCRRVLRHEQDAEDAFQAAFLVLARKAESIRASASIGGWLHQVAFRLAQRARALGARREARLAPLIHEPEAPVVPLPLALDEELSSLPEAYRSAIILCYLEGRTQSEAAELLATSEDAINGRLKRARELLRLRLARHGLVLSGAGVGQALTVGAASATIALATIAHTARVAVLFMTDAGQGVAASALATTLAQGALQPIIPAKCTILSVLALVVALFVSGALLVPSSAREDGADPAQHDRIAQLPADAVEKPAPKTEKVKRPRQCVILWMNGGPSQIDTFDPKEGKIALFKSIDTNVKGIQFAETLPRLAKQANHLAILRGVSHREGDHMRSSILMRTGFAPGQTAFPSLGCVLGKELAGAKTKLPRYVSIDAMWKPEVRGFGPGFLGAKYGPLLVGGTWFRAPNLPAGETFPVPAEDAFTELDKDNGPAMRKAVQKAFDLGAEKAEVRDAYGRGRFGHGCLLARRLIEAGVPVVEVAQNGWDTHQNAVGDTKKVCGDLDAGMSSLLKDLHERKLLDNTLVVWMGEFGRTPRVNAGGGRDHWPMSFTVVLAGRGIKGGQVIGKTSADSMKIDERPVTPPELLATVYQALGVDPAKRLKLPDGPEVPLVETGNKAVKEALQR